MDGLCSPLDTATFMPCKKIQLELTTDIMRAKKIRHELKKKIKKAEKIRREIKEKIERDSGNFLKVEDRTNPKPTTIMTEKSSSEATQKGFETAPDRKLLDENKNTAVDLVDNILRYTIPDNHRTLRDYYFDQCDSGKDRWILLNIYWSVHIGFGVSVSELQIWRETKQIHDSMVRAFATSPDELSRSSAMWLRDHAHIFLEEKHEVFDFRAYLKAIALIED